MKGWNKALCENNTYLAILYNNYNVLYFLRLYSMDYWEIDAKAYTCMSIILQKQEYISFHKTKYG